MNSSSNNVSKISTRVPPDRLKGLLLSCCGRGGHRCTSPYGMVLEIMSGFMAHREGGKEGRRLHAWSEFMWGETGKG